MSQTFTVSVLPQVSTVFDEQADMIKTLFPCLLLQKRF